jgi:putative ABC transport system permease protein
MNQTLLYSGIFRRFLRQKVKTFLLMVGVTIGVFVLTSGLVLGMGLKQSVLEFFGKTFLPDSLTLGTNFDVPDARPITEADVAALLTEIPALTAWSPLMSGGRVDLERDGVVQRAGLTGVSPQAQLTIGQSAASGTYLDDTDLNTRARVAVIGHTVKEKLYSTSDPVGEQLTIGSQVYTIKGVLNRLGGDPHGGDLDNNVVIPYTTLLQINKGEGLINVRFRVASGQVESAAARIGELLRVRHNITDGRRDDFYVSTAPAGQAMFNQMESMFRMLFPLIVGVILLISLLVIASLMLIGVKERTAEIGLRKAVGARTRDVSRQFVLETVLIALMGGVLGIMLSYPGLLYIEEVFSVYRTPDSAVSFVPGPGQILVGLLSALITGLLAAILPARRAAALPPHEALR